MTIDVDRQSVRDIIASWVASHGSVRFGLDANSTMSLMIDDALSSDLVMCSDNRTDPRSLISCKAADWDSDILDVRVGRFLFLSSSQDCSDDTKNSLVSRFLESAKNRFDLLVGRLDSRDVSDLNVLENAGFRIMDSLVTLVTESVKGNVDSSIRLSVPTDRPFLEEIARQSFRTGHYHADPWLSSNRCDYLYSQWVRNSCAGRAAAVFVAESNGELSGFITCLLHAKDGVCQKYGTIDLVAVAPDKQGHGLGGKLVSTALSWFRKQGVGHVEVGTQISNTPAIRLYQRFGFQVFRTVYTVHGWPNLHASLKEDTSHA